MKSRHLAFFIKSMSGGGGERVMLNLVQEFSRRGHRVDLVLPRARGPLLAEVPDTVRVVDLRTRTALTALPGMWRCQLEALHLLRSVARGVAQIHQRREYHGDLHDRNVLVRRRGVHF